VFIEKSGTQNFSFSVSLAKNFVITASSVKMSAPAKRWKVLSQTQISELIWDSDSDEAGASSYSSSEDEGGFEDKPGVSHLQPDCPTSIGQISSSSSSGSASDEEEAVQSGPGRQVQMPSTSWTRPSSPRTSIVHMYTRGNRRKKDQEAPHINDGSSPLSIFLLYERTVPRPLGRQPSAATQMSRLEASGSKHWPIPCAKQVSKMLRVFGQG
jgi:hypothetical protein